MSSSSGKRRVYPGQQPPEQLQAPFSPQSGPIPAQATGSPVPQPGTSGSMNFLTSGVQQMNLNQQQPQQRTSAASSPGYYQQQPQVAAHPQPGHQQQPQQPAQPQPGQGIPAASTGYQQTQAMSKNVQLIGMQPNITLLNGNSFKKTNINMQNPNHSPIPCPYAFVNSTLNQVPKDHHLLQKSKIPLGLIISPYKQLGMLDIMPVVGGTDRKDINQPVYSAPSISRCMRCRAYINPYIEFVDNTHWRCNFCYIVNGLPSFFDYNVQTQQYEDRYSRPEIKYSMVEYVAPSDYMIRPPQPAVFIFLIDVSSSAIASGTLHALSSAMLDVIHDIPNDDQRARVAFILYDTAVHFVFFDIERGETSEMIIVDADDVFLPAPDNLLVNLIDVVPLVESFFQKFPSRYQVGVSGNAMGSALQAAYELGNNLGGKILVFNASLPSRGSGVCTNRSDSKLMNTSLEGKLMQPQNSFYKGFAIDSSRKHLSVDYFLFGTSYLDIATLSGACRFTAGSQYYYPGFSAVDFEKFSRDLYRNLTRPLGLESVLRVRCSKGIRCDAFYGNFFLRSSDLLALSTVSPDHAFAFQFTIEEPIQTNYAAFQSSLLYTTQFGERRIRVATVCYPVVSDLGSVFSGADERTLAAFIAKMAIERSLTSKIEDAREAVLNKISELVVSWRSIQSQAGLCLPENLTLVPVLCLGLLKSTILGPCDDIDKRCAVMDFVRIASTEALIRFIYPKLYEIHSITGNEGTMISRPSSPSKIRALEPEDLVCLPRPINLTSEKFVRHGVYLMDAETVLYLWISREAPPPLLRDLLGKPYEAIQSGKCEPPILDTAINERLRNIIDNCRKKRWPQFVVVKEEGDPVVRTAFLNLLVEDRTASGNSYVTFMGMVRDKCK